jgi:hypothetical protein
MPSPQQFENAAAWNIEQMLNQQGRAQVRTYLAYLKGTYKRVLKSGNAGRPGFVTWRKRPML